MARGDRRSRTLAETGFSPSVGRARSGELLGSIIDKKTTMRLRWLRRSSADNEQKIIRDCLRCRGTRGLRTGDLLQAETVTGYYYFVDRIGDTFRWKGENVATQEVTDVLNEAPGVSETTVYGVELRGSDGRAGMAAVVLARGASFDGAAFHARAAAHLPPYARPAFVRVAEAIEVTGTLKQRKRHLSEQGWDPARVSDPLFVRDDDAATYVPLTPALAADVRAGRRRL